MFSVILLLNPVFNLIYQILQFILALLLVYGVRIILINQISYLNHENKILIFI